MDFNDTPQEAEFRAEARAFLARSTASPLQPGEIELDALASATSPTTIKSAQGLADLQEVRQRLGVS